MGATVIVAIAGFGAVALVVGLVWWLASWARTSSTDARAQEVAGVRRDVELDQRLARLEELVDERDRALAALRKTQEVASRAIANLAEHADVDVLVDALNSELSALSALSNLPAAGAGAPGEDDPSASAVHGAADIRGGAEDRPDLDDG